MKVVEIGKNYINFFELVSIRMRSYGRRRVIWIFFINGFRKGELDLLCVFSWSHVCTVPSIILSAFSKQQNRSSQVCSECTYRKVAYTIGVSNFSGIINMAIPLYPPDLWHTSFNLMLAKPRTLYNTPVIRKPRYLWSLCYTFEIKSCHRSNRMISLFGADGCCLHDIKTLFLEYFFFSHSVYLKTATLEYIKEKVAKFLLLQLKILDFSLLICSKFSNFAFSDKWNFCFNYNTIYFYQIFFD